MTQFSKKKKELTASEFARLGGLKGGPARAAKLTSLERKQIAMKGAAARMTKISPKRRAEIARNAVMARWNKHK